MGRQKIVDESEAERARTELLKLQAEAQAKSAQIEGQAAVAQASQWCEANKIRHDAELAQKQAKQKSELSYSKQQNQLEVQKAREEAAIEVAKFKQIVDAIGADTIASIAAAGPEMQAKLLGGLGLQSVLITDGASPINLFNTANQLIQ